MAKLRHIALIVPDPDKAAKFFEEAFDMKVAGRARRGLYVSDGTINVALLKQEGNEKVGIYHFGMWVDDLDEAEKKVVKAGGTYLDGRPAPAPRPACQRALVLRGQVQGPARHRVRSHPYRLDRRSEGRGGEELTARGSAHPLDAATSNLAAIRAANGVGSLSHGERGGVRG